MEKEALIELLNHRNLKATRPRLELLEAMQSYDSAMPYSEMQKALQEMDRVTLYRTLESLMSKGIIHKAYQEKNNIYYAVCGSTCQSTHHDHEHVHFRCVKCESVTCEKPKRKVSINIPDFEIYNVSINVEGICSVCR